MDLFLLAFGYFDKECILTQNMHWIYLILAITFEVAGTTCMKLSDGFTKMAPSALMWVFYGICFGCPTFALKKVDVSMAYA